LVCYCSFGYFTSFRWSYSHSYIRYYCVVTIAFKLISHIFVSFMDSRIVFWYLCRYLFYYSLIDFLTILVYLIALGKGDYTINYFKLIIILKFTRINQIDTFYQRKLSLHIKSKTLYVIIKQIIILVWFAHIISLGFYSIDNYFVSSSTCEGDNSDCNLYFYDSMLVKWINRMESDKPIKLAIAIFLFNLLGF